MADCVTITQNLQSLCCDGVPVAGSATIDLVAPATATACQLFDPANSAWVSPGRVGTFNIGAVTANAWQSCPLPCLEDLQSGGNTAISLGYYYNITVRVAGADPCTYQVALDCTTLGLAPGSTTPLEDVIVSTPTTPAPGSALCTAFKACETNTTIVDNGNGTFTYTNEAGSAVTITAGTGGGTTNPSTLAVNGSIITHTSGTGVVTPVDVCALVSANCENALAFNNATGVLSLTLHGGTTQSVNIGGQETVTTLVNNGNGSYTYTSENGSITTFDVDAGPVATLQDGGGGNLVFNPGTGAAPTTIPICTLFDAGNCETTTTLVNNAAANSFTYTNEAGTPVTVNYGGGGTGTETTTTLVPNANGSFTYTNEAGTAVTYTPPAQTTTTLIDNAGANSFTYTNEDGVTTTVTYGAGGAVDTNTTYTLTQNPTAGSATLTGSDGTTNVISVADLETTTTLVDNAAANTFIYTNEDGVAVTVDYGETNTTLVNNVAQKEFTYTNENGTAVIVNYGETTTTLVNDGNGLYTYTNELGTTTTFRSRDTEKMTFIYPEAITATGSSGLAIDDSAYEVYAYAVTVDVAPTGAETFNVLDLGPTGAGSTTVISGTLASGSRTTGIVATGPYTVAAGNLVQSNILTVGSTPSQKWTLTLFYRENFSELIA